MKLLVINGPNLNMLGIREPEVYGTMTYKGLCEFINGTAANLGVEAQVFQSNHEGAIVDKIQEAYQKFDGIVINPAAYTHTSVAILDALKAVNIPCIEVHLSDVYKREEFRHHSYIRAACIKSYVGQGFLGYQKAMEDLLAFLENKVNAR